MRFFCFALCLLLALSPLGRFSASLFAADSASIQMAVASPDPVQSGSEITFQVILANNGTDVWEAGRYYFEIQIYDSKKNYLIKSSRLLGDGDVKPGKTALAYIPFKVPENYSGPHFFRVFMAHKEQRIYEGNYIFFSVTPLPPQPPEEKPVTFGGNVVVSAKTYSTDKNKDVANVSVNSVGQVYGRSMMFNLNTQTTRPSHTKIIQMLLTFYGPMATMNFGDIQPNFSPLSYANSGARGLWIQMPIKRFSTEIIGAQSVYKVTGSSSPARTGTFARYVIGAQEKVELPKNFTFAVDYITAFDDKNSLSADPKDSEYRGPDPKEIKNEVKSGLLMWKGFSQKLTVEGQMAQSDYSENTLSEIVQSASAHGQAVRFGASYRGTRFSAKTGVQRTDPEFRALMAPSATSDRMTVELGLGYNLPVKKAMLGINLNGNQFSDNIKSDPKKITTTQTSIILNTSLSNPRPWPALGLSASMNQGQDKTKTALDNQTQTFGLNVSQPVGGRTTLTLGVQQSQFKDNLKKSSDLTSNTQSFGLTSSVGTRINVSLGGTLAKTSSQATETTPSGSLSNTSYSASLNWQVIKDRLVSQFWLTMANRSGDSSGVKQDVKDQSMNLELTYQLIKRLALTIGASKNKSDDAVTSARNIDETVTTVRISVAF